MRYFLIGYLCFLLGVTLFWVFNWANPLPVDIGKIETEYLLGVMGVYAMSHIFRMLRLTLLTLDQREYIFPLVAAHALTALPSSLLPFKIGEALRLGSFFFVYRHKKKSLAVWLAERFGDISVISLFILMLYLFDVDVPEKLRNLFIFFFMFSLLALMIFLSVAKLFTYLNRYLVLSSTSRKGLALLKISHKLRQLEGDIQKSFEGRFLSVCLLSVFIWACEMITMVLFLKGVNVNFEALSEYFLAGLSGVFHGAGSKTMFDIMQDTVLVFMSIFFGIIVAIGSYLQYIKTEKQQK